MKNLYKLLKPGVTALVLLFFVLLLCNFANAQTAPCQDSYLNYPRKIDINGTCPAKWVKWLTNTGIAARDFVNDAAVEGKESQLDQASDEADLDTWKWSVKPVSGKTNLTNAGAVIYDPNKKTLYFFCDLEQTNGNASVGFWVLLGGSGPNPDGTFSPKHAVGDLLILMNFSNGGYTATPSIYRWTGSGLASATADAGSFTNSVNELVPTSFPGWRSDWDSWTYPGGVYGPTAFFEGYADLTNLLTDANVLCNATFMMETRNSDQINSTLSDFLYGSFHLSPVLAITNPMAVCAPGTVNLTLPAVTAGSELPTGTVLSYWTDAGGTVTLTTPAAVAASGTYYIKATSTISGCTDINPVVVTINPKPTCSVTPPSAAVCSGFTQSFTVTPAGGTGPYSVLWAGPSGFTSTSTTITVGVGGTYTATVTDSKGCSSAGCTGVLTVNPKPTCSVTPPTAAVCSGFTQSFTVTPAGGTGPYSVLWAGPSGFTSTSTIITVGVGGTYTATVTDSKGCSSAGCTGVLTVNPLPSCSIEGPGATCTGTSAVFTATAGMNSYAWQGPGAFSGSTRSVTVSVGGTYTVTITNSNGCQSTCSKTLTVNPLPTCSIDGLAAICSGTSTVYTAASGMSSYLWTGPSSFSGTTRSVTVSTGGTYTVTITNSNGCKSTCSKVLTLNPKPTCSVTPLTAKICAGSTQSFTVVPAGGTGPYSVVWAGPGFTSTSTIITVGVGGTYTATVTDSKGCVSVGCAGVLTVTPCDFCTYTQGFYGNQKGKACDLTTTPKPGAAFTAALLAEGSMVIGAGSNKITFGTGDALLIQAILPGGGGSSVLSGICDPPVFDPGNIDFGCLDDMGLLKDRQHRLNNTLLAQTITLGLNMRIGDNRLGGFKLESGKWLVTQDKKSCAENSGFVEPVCYNSGSVATPVCTLQLPSPYHYDKLDAGVICYMSKNGYAMTVQGLFNLANDALGGVKTFPAVVNCGSVTSTVTLSSIAGTVDMINNIFDECKGFAGYWENQYTCTSCPSTPRSALIPGEQQTSLGVYPNPFNQQVTFEFIPGKDAHATLDIYNMLGQKVKTLMSRQVEQGANYKVDFRPVNVVPGVLIYRLVLDDEVQTGKVVYNK